jgi:hypothetical protein
VPGRITGNAGCRMKEDRNKDQVDSNLERGKTELPDRSGRLTGHARQPLKGTDPKTAAQQVRSLLDAEPNDSIHLNLRAVEVQVPRARLPRRLHGSLIGRP